MRIPENIFKEYDLRGIAATDLTDEIVNRIGLAIGTYFRRNAQKDVVLCQDVRESSPRITRRMANALVEAGCDVIDIGVHPTPICYFAGRFFKKSASVMVTASHNPGEYNGMKITSQDVTIYGDEIQLIRKMAAEGDLEYGAGSISTYSGIEDDYVSYLKDNIKILRPLRIAIDAGNGTAGPVSVKLFKALGCEVIELFCTPDSSFPNHHPDPTVPENLETLRKVVLDNDLDVGLAFDGDGDRLGVIDDRGQIIWGDMLQILFWRELLLWHPGAPVIVEVKCSQALVEDVVRLGGKPFFYKTGHSLIKAKMRELGLLFAGEMSGHMFFADEYFGYDDALYAAARLLRLLSETDKPLSILLNDVPKYYATPEIRINIPEESRLELMEVVKKHFAESSFDVIDVDGVRVNFGEGWGLLRLSNTQPVMVMRAEARSSDQLAVIVAELENILKDAIARMGQKR